MAHPDSSRTGDGLGTLSSAAELPRGRRRHRRFMATYRVEYKVGRHRAISFMANLSLGGMFLRSADKLTLDAELEFVLFLENKQKLSIRGVVRYTGSRGAGIEFVSDQDEARDGLRAFVEAHVINKLEKAVAGNRPSARKVIELASLYQELDRDADALGLYTKGVAGNPRDVELHEHVVRYLVSRCGVLSGKELEPVLGLLDRTVELGLNVKSTDILEIGRRVVDEQRESLNAEAVGGAASRGITEHKQAEEQRQAVGTIDAEVQRVVEEKLAEVQEAFEQKLAAALEAQRHELDEKHREEIERKQAQWNETAENLAQTALDAERQRREIEEERERLHQDAKNVAQQHFELSTERQEIDSVTDQLQKQSGEIDAGRGAIDAQLEEIDELKSQISSERQELHGLTGPQTEALDAQHATLAKMREELEQRQLDMEHEGARMSKSAKDIESLRRELDDKRQDLEEQQAKLEQTRQEMKRDPESLDKQRQAIAKHAEALAVQEMQLVAQGKLLSEKLGAQRRGIAEENDALEEMRAELEKGRTELQAQRAKIDEDLEARSKQAESERSELANEWEEVLAARQALEVKNAELRSARQGLEQKMRELSVPAEPENFAAREEKTHVEELRADPQQDRTSLTAERRTVLELQQATADQHRELEDRASVLQRQTRAVDGKLKTIESLQAKSRHVDRTRPFVDLPPPQPPRRPSIARAVALIGLGVVATVALVLAFDAATPGSSGGPAGSGSFSAEDSGTSTGVAVADATPALEPKPPSPEPTDTGTVDDLKDWLPPIPQPKRPQTKSISKAWRGKTSSAEPSAPLGEAAASGSPPTAESQRSSCDEAIELIRARKAVRALAKLDRCLALNPSYARAHILVGRAHLMLGHSDKAITAFEQVLKLAPDHKDGAKLRKIINAYRASLRGR